MEYCIKLSVVTLFVVIVLFAIIESLVQFLPSACFDTVPNCQVSVTHAYNVSDLTCTDTFSYFFVLPGSPAEYAQTEQRQREAGDCLLDLDISERNATFLPGDNVCFSVLGICGMYTQHFNCAGGSPRNNATKGPCQTLFPPTSTFDDLNLIAFAGVLVLMCLYCGIDMIKNRCRRECRREWAHNELNASA